MENNKTVSKLNLWRNWFTVHRKVLQVFS